MGSDKALDKEAEDDETPQYPVLVDDFAIGQHPVTVAEYACAVRAKAVRVAARRLLCEDHLGPAAPAPRSPSRLRLLARRRRLRAPGSPS